MMIFDAVPLYGDGWMLHVLSHDWDTGEMYLVGDCGGVTYYEEDFPTESQQVSWWTRYWRYVMESGDDCLKQLPLTPYKTDETWQLAFMDSLLGVFVWGRQESKGNWLFGDELPEHVQEWLSLRDDLLPSKSVIHRDAISNVASLKALRDDLAWGKKTPRSLKKPRSVWCTAQIPFEVDPTPEDIKQRAEEQHEDTRTRVLYP